jgi:hypothetical protein
MSGFSSSIFRAAIFLLLLATNAALARQSDCLFEIDGQRIIDGPCQFFSRPGGSFQILTLKGAGIEYVAEVNRIAPSQAVGYWNARLGDPRPQTPLGSLMSSGACWTNARVRVCAWRWGEERYFVEAPPAPHVVSPPQAPTADTSQIPTQVGNCVQTEIASLGSRLEGSPDSGSAVGYANNIYGVSYEVIDSIRNSRVGDPVTLCLVSLPQDCPKGDERGKVYSAINLRTKQGWSLADSEHMCGGA